MAGRPYFVVPETSGTRTCTKVELNSKMLAFLHCTVGNVGNFGRITNNVFLNFGAIFLNFS